MRQRPRSPKTSGRTWLGRALVFAGACVLPLVLLFLVTRVAGDVNRLLAAIRPVAVIGPAVAFLSRAIVSLYFPAFLFNGSVSVEPSFAVLGLYVLFAVVYLARGRWVSGGVLFVVPIMSTWILSAVLLRDLIPS
jgi:hypothetical protein